MFEGKNILVAGGTGTIGAQVVEQLLAKQANVTVVSMDDEEYALKVLGPDLAIDASGLILTVGFFIWAAVALRIYKNDERVPEIGKLDQDELSFIVENVDVEVKEFKFISLVEFMSLNPSLFKIIFLFFPKFKLSISKISFCGSNACISN